jgi:hypothetical protein
MTIAEMLSPSVDHATGAIAPVRIGAAVVTDCESGRARVLFEGSPLSARLALAFAYQPLPGDVVLIIVQAEDAYIIGVLSGRGTTTLAVHADLALSAPHGRISLRAGHGIDLDAPQVAVRAQAIEMTAVTLVQRVQTAFKTFTDLLHITAGRRHTRIDGVSMESTERTYHRSDKETVLNGESINIA